jgi:hypothetical protein
VREFLTVDGLVKIIDLLVEQHPVDVGAVTLAAGVSRIRR